MIFSPMSLQVQEVIASFLCKKYPEKLEFFTKCATHRKVVGRVRGMVPKKEPFRASSPGRTL